MEKKIVKINGWEYYYNTTTNKLYLEIEMITEIPEYTLTFDEKQQIESQVKYNGVPMISY